MASLELQRLWKLAQIDNRLHDIRARAAAFNPGRELHAQLKALEADDEKYGGQARSLSTEQKDLELQQAALADKLKRLDAELYGGKVVNAREVENYEREIASIKKQQSKNDDRLLTLMEMLPPSQAKAKVITDRIAQLQKELAVKRNEGLAERASLETEFKQLTAARQPAAQTVPPGILARYENAKQRAGGIGMVQVTKERSCGGCGTMLPERTIVSLQDDKVVICESCHRILYYTDGLV